MGRRLFSLCFGIGASFFSFNRFVSPSELRTLAPSISTRFPLRHGHGGTTNNFSSSLTTTTTAVLHGSTASSSFKARSQNRPPIQLGGEKLNPPSGAAGIPIPIAAMTNDGVVPAAPAPLDGVAVAEDNHAAAARRFGGGGFVVLRNRRFRAALYLAAWGVAGIISTTVPGIAANPDHVMVYFLLLMAAVLLLVLSMAAVDLPWLERVAARLEDMF